MEKNTKNLSLFDFIEDDIDSDSDYEEYGIAKNADKDGYFNKAVDDTTKEPSRVVTRFNKFADILSNLPSCKMNITRFEYDGTFKKI